MSISLTVRFVTGESFPLVIAADATVRALKEAIQAAKGEAGFAADAQKIVASGKILKDGDTLAASEVKDQSFVVCMVTKPKVRKGAAPSARARAARACLRARTLQRARRPITLASPPPPP